MENWKEVVGFEELYLISDLGNVKSLDRRVKSRFKTRVIKGKTLKTSLDRNGYPYISLRKDHKYKMKRIHQLVAEAFLNHVPCGHKLVVNHIDFNRTNNSLTNLEIITARKNTDQKHLPSVSRHTGVTWSKKARKWYASINFKRKQTHIGSFDTEEDAARAHQLFSKEANLL